jgi:hypothetical protein
VLAWKALRDKMQDGVFEVKAYIIYLDQADPKFGESNEQEEDLIADFFSGLDYSGEVRSELTGNSTSFEAGHKQKEKNEVSG